MPLLVGLLDAAAIRRSSDGSISMTHTNGEGNADEGDVDLEAIAAKRTAGGGLLDSVANMANSILGAGRLTALLYGSYTHIRSNRHYRYYLHPSSCLSVVDRAPSKVCHMPLVKQDFSSACSYWSHFAVSPTGPYA